MIMDCNVSVLSCSVKMLKKSEWLLKIPHSFHIILRNSSKAGIIEKENLLATKNLSEATSESQKIGSKFLKNALKNSAQKCEKKKDVKSGKSFVRKNELNIQMLPHSLYEQIFCYNKEDNVNKHKENECGSDNNLVLNAKKELMKFGLWTDEVDILPDVSLNLPKLFGKNIEEHFWHIGKEQSEPYKKLLLKFLKSGIPQAPKHWLYQKGWTKYKAGEEPISVAYPDEDALVLDVEVCMKVGEAPTLAVAVSPDCWYGWVSRSLVEEENSINSNYYTTDVMIPLQNSSRGNNDRCRIVVGHNVSFDRARIKEQYYLEGCAMRFIDTMSLHICIGGSSRVQKTLMKTASPDEDKEIWRGSSCLSSLKDLYSLYCKSDLSKVEKNIFVEGSLEDVRRNFQQVMAYCSMDVKATFEVFCVLFPVFLKRFPHPVTLAGMLEMGTAFLTVNKNWEKYLKDAEEKFEDLESEISFLLGKKCDYACRLMHDEEYKKDLWMWNEDWSRQELKLTKRKVDNCVESEEESASNEFDDDETTRLAKKFKYLIDMEKVLPVKRPLLPGYPAWYRKLCSRPESPDWKPGPQSLTTSLTITPKILNLTYENYPLHHIRELGWGILVADLRAEDKKTSLPLERLKEVTAKNMSARKGGSCAKEPDRKIRGDRDDGIGYDGSAVWCDHKIDDCCYFFKLPHKDGNIKNVGQPLSKSFNTVFSSDKLAGSDAVAEKALEVGNVMSYWRNNRDRILGQTVVWLGSREIGSNAGSERVGVILPKIVVSGTLTRRAVEPTWLTASKSTVERLGSELRSMIQAPPGYHFVGADVDSQELWIASLIGDSCLSKMHGGTPFGWMTLRGTKLNGTDMHSITAKAAGISREHAKVINYARIYGAGVQFAQKLLQQFNPSMPLHEAKAKASKMYMMTKGRKVFRLKKEFARKFRFGEDAQVYDLNSAINLAKKLGEPIESVFEHRKWQGGSESEVFNQLERIANSPKPETPFLQSRLSRSLEPRFTGDDLFLNTRINWVVQSGAVDFLHLMLVCMRWLTGGRVRFCLSFHDEVRYLVESRHRYQAALALQMTNLLTRSFFAHRMGLHDLPLSVAFFSSVEVDRVMRKEASDECVTLSNPHGLEKGYGIPKGESLNIYETIRKSGGEITAFAAGL